MYRGRGESLDDSTKWYNKQMRFFRRQPSALDIFVQIGLERDRLFRVPPEEREGIGLNIANLVLSLAERPQREKNEVNDG